MSKARSIATNVIQCEGNWIPEISRRDFLQLTRDGFLYLSGLCWLVDSSAQIAIYIPVGQNLYIV
jgi:hypothetical protein